MGNALAIAAILMRLLGNSDFQALDLKKPVERELRGGDLHHYRIHLGDRSFVRLQLMRQAVDVRVIIWGLKGEKLRESASLNEAIGTLPMLFIADQGGEYRVEVQANGVGSPSGRYRILLEEVRPARAEDADRVLAFDTYAKAEELTARATAASQRQAIPLFEQAAQAASRAGELELEAGALDLLALVYRNLSDGNKALEYLSQALDRWRQLNHRQGEAHALSIMGGVYTMLGLTEEALDAHRRALELERAVGTQAELAPHLNNVGMAYQHLGDPLKAIEHFNEALSLFRASHKALAEGVTLHNIGVARQSMGELQQAIECYQQALEILHATGNPRREALTLSNLGTIYSELGAPRMALQWFDRALALKRLAGDRHGEAITLLNVGNAYLALRNPKKALEYLIQAGDLNKSIGDRRNEAEALNEIGGAHDTAGEAREAAEHFRRSADLARAIGDPAIEGRAIANLAKVKVDLGDNEAALAVVAPSLSLARAAHLPSVEIEALAVAARAQLNLGLLEEARTNIEDALAKIESTRSKVISESLRTSYSSLLHSYYELCISILFGLHQRFPSQGYDALALQVNERARARGLLELLNEARVDILEGVDSDLLARSRRLQWRLGAEAEVANRAGSRQATATEAARRRIDALSLEYEQVQAEIRRKSPWYAALTQPQPLTAREIQANLLDDETLLLEYSVGNEKSFAWVVSRDTLHTFQLPGRAALSSKVSRLRQLISQRASTPKNETATQRKRRINQTELEYLRVASELSRILLGPCERWLGRKRLVIVPDGALQFIPFAALPLPSSVAANLSPGAASRTKGWAPLVLEHELVNLPSASVLAVLRAEQMRRPPAPRSVAVFADPVFSQDDPRLRRVAKAVVQNTELQFSQLRGPDDGDEQAPLSRLPFSRREANAIRQITPTDSFEALDFSASRAAALDPALGDYRIIHFATHGFIDGDHPELSGLILSLFNEQGQPEDGFLRLQDIYNLRLNAQLVILSACQSGLGKLSKAEGLIGLTRGFMYAGARRVMSSLWRVDDAATAELMRRVYQGIFDQHLSPAAALRQAQLALWSDARWTFPIYWAPFVISGEWSG